MKKAIWIPIVTGVIGLILIPQRDFEQGSVAKAPQASVMKTSLEMDANAPSDGKIDFAPRTQKGLRNSPENPQWGEFHNLVAEIMQRDDLSPQERQGLHALLSQTSR